MADGRDEKQRRASRRGGSGPTVADVARAAGVSPMTVSRVVNAEPRVLPATRDKVQAAIAALGYVPNPAARNLAGRRPCRIALIHANPSAAYLSEFLVGSLAGAAEADAELVVERWQPGESPQALARKLEDHRLDGVVLPPPLCDDLVLARTLTDAGLPIALVATGQPRDGLRSVTIDDEAGAYAIASHLVALGHTRIGIIIGDPNQTASALREAGYRRALEEAGIAADPALRARGDFSYRSGLEAANVLLAAPTRPTAIFASNDDMAAAAIAAAHRHGLDVPRDLSVCGFDDSAMARTIWPEITTIHQPIADMARRALAGLAQDIRQSPTSPPLHEQLPFELVRRQSAAFRPGRPPT
jgi:LacI family transcriptional regulator